MVQILYELCSKGYPNQFQNSRKKVVQTNRQTFRIYISKIDKRMQCLQLTIWFDCTLLVKHFAHEAHMKLGETMRLPVPKEYKIKIVLATHHSKIYTNTNYLSRLQTHPGKGIN